MKFKKENGYAVEAMLFVDNDTAAEILEWAGSGNITVGIDPATGIAKHLYIQTPGGETAVPLENWVYKNEFGEFGTMAPESFVEVFQRAD